MTPLYTSALLRLASQTDATPWFDDADGVGTARSKTCGGRIDVALGFDADGSIGRYGHRVSACAMGQASATLFARAVIGRNADEIGTARAALARWLSGEDASLDTWPEFASLEPARTRPARYGAILLPFDAALAALARVPA